MKKINKTAALVAFTATLYTGLGLDTLASYSIASQEVDSEQCEDKPFKAFKKISNFSPKKGYKPLTLKLVKKVKKKLKSKPCIDAPKRAAKPNIETAQYIEPQIETKPETKPEIKYETGIPEPNLNPTIALLPTLKEINTNEQRNNSGKLFPRFEYTPNFSLGYPVYVYLNGSSTVFRENAVSDNTSPASRPAEVPLPITALLLIPGLVYLWKKIY